MRKSLLVLCLVVGLCAAGLVGPVQAQINRPHSILLGGSVGTGGLYDFFKYSFDLHYRRGQTLNRFYGLNGVFTSLRFAPGLHYLSMGVTQRVGYFRTKVRQRERPIILSLYNNREFFLTQLQHPDRDRQMVMAMVGIRANLDRIQRVFCEASVGAMYVTENEADNRYFPMVEFRISGIVQRHVKTYAKKKKK